MKISPSERMKIIIDEYLMVCDLLLVKERLTTKQKKFVENLYKHLDPHEIFLNQQSEKSKKWLKWIHNRHIKHTEEHW